MQDPFRKRFSTSLGKKLTRFLAKHEKASVHTMRNTRPIASFTFDDVPDSAYTEGARVLDEHGVKGTFYVASGTCGAQDTHWRVISEAQVLDLHARGHEIGCHTLNHVNVHTLSPRELAFECDRNAANLERICQRPLELPSFCYPFGDLGIAQKRYLQKRFSTCRSIYEGFNAGTIDLGMLLVIECFDATLTPDKLARVIEEARRLDAWIVFYTHDVTEDPTFMGCSPGVLGRVVAAVKDAGFDVATMAGALPLIGLEPIRTSTEAA